MAELRAGWGELVSRTWLWVIVVQFSLWNMAFVAALSVYAPLVAEQSYGGAAAYGWVVAANGAGMAVRGLVMAAPAPATTLAAGDPLFMAGVRRQSTYRLAALGGLVANTTFGLLKVALLLAAVRAGGGELAGYDAATLGAYIWLSQGLLGSLNLHWRSEAADHIKSGDVAVDFLRPLDVQLAAVTTECGRAVFALLPPGSALGGHRCSGR